MRRIINSVLLFVSTVAFGGVPIGITSLHPWDSTLTHDLQRTIPAEYVLVDLNYEWWNTGIPDAAEGEGDGPTFYDEMMALNSDYKIIFSISAISDAAVATFLPMILARYSTNDIWGVRPVNEVSDVGVIAATVTAYRAAVPNMRLIGPDYQNNYAPGILDPLIASGTLAKLDVLAMHDYFAVPGNGTAAPQPWGEYFHPHEQPYGDYPNLTNRINWMKTYLPNLRQVMSGPKIMITEYGLYPSNVVDAASAAEISRRSGVIFVLSAPQSPAYQTNSLPYGNGVYLPDGINPTSAVWTPAMQEYLRIMSLNALTVTASTFTSATTRLNQ